MNGKMFLGILIVTFLQLHNFLTRIKDEPILGFDCEFHSTKAQNDKVAIIQIATR